MPIKPSKQPESVKSYKQEQIELLKQEIDVNDEEQVLLKKRIFLMQDYMNELPNYDPTWVALDKQVLIDQIHLDEIKRNGEDLAERLKILNI
jgi:hypothetical protein